MAKHAFVAMPYGEKEHIRFNEIYTGYIKPALTTAGFEVFRADEERRAGNIRTDMFQELLLADLVVVDLSIDNPNVWYELGIRHALRARGVVQIQCTREYLPFDVYVDRSLRYHIKNGIPDPDYLESDRQQLAQMAIETATAWQGRKVSPVYHLLRYLQEPNWKSLRVEDAKEFWDKFKTWESRLEVVRRRGRAGDILVLAEEVPTRILRLEAYQAAGKALLNLGQFEFALKLYEKALESDPTDHESRRQKGIILGRLKKPEEAKVWLRHVIEDHPEDPETWALLGRIEKDAWTNAWRVEGKASGQMREDAASDEAVLRESIDAYETGFRKDPRHYYSGINALTLLHLLRHLTDGTDGKDGKKDKDTEVQALEGGVRWAVQSALAATPKDYWRASRPPNSKC